MTPESRPNADHFKGAVEHARWELDLLWRVHATFLIPLIFLLGFSLQASVSSQTSPDARGLIVIALLLGLLMCLPWFVIGQRGQSSYDFRMAQARTAEPADGNLIAGDGKKFADGEPVKIDNKTYQSFGAHAPLSWFRSRHASRVLVGFVAAIYLASIVFILHLPAKPLSSGMPLPAPFATSYPLPVPSAEPYPLPVPSTAPYPIPVASPSPFPWPFPSPTDGRG